MTNLRVHDEPLYSRVLLGGAAAFQSASMEEAPSIAKDRESDAQFRVCARRQQMRIVVED